MAYTLGEAAKATGKTKPTILRAIQTHKISAIKHEVTGAWQIEPAELHRVYQPVSADASNGVSNPHENGETLRGVMADETLLRRELALREEQLGALREERERERGQLQAQIDDLSRRLDTEAEERRRTQAQLTALLTDQRQAKAAEPDATARRRWWRFGGRG